MTFLVAFLEARQQPRATYPLFARLKQQQSKTSLYTRIGDRPPFIHTLDIQVFLRALNLRWILATLLNPILIISSQEPIIDSATGRVHVRARGLPGHLHKVKLENFMCHDNVEVSFGTHVNVISGTNGSGKSAVMQALQCCLGASARSTGRATNLAGFIKTGAHEAKVRVTVWNTGARGAGEWKQRVRVLSCTKVLVVCFPPIVCQVAL